MAKREPQKYRWPVVEGEQTITCKDCEKEVIKKFSQKNGTLIMVDPDTRLGHKFPGGQCTELWVMHEEQGAKRRAQTCQLSAELKKRIRDQANQLHYVMELLDMLAQHVGLDKLPKPPISGEEERTPF